MADQHGGVPQTADTVVAFWKQAGPRKWFKKNAAFDTTFRHTFYDLHFMAARRELDPWMRTADGALALLILLDQYPRNAFRGTAHMFATDSLARFYADQMIAAGMDQEVERGLRMFCYLPFEHSENPVDQERSVRLNRELEPNDFKWAQEHARIIDRFGRFAHRNTVLGRVSTLEEEAFLREGGFAG
ncbi:DUF924 family protein [Pseudomonas japonica]|uniref:DUF924 family protein n=1 Tax=Pseudomonas japonica TaxID=256466 RepID=UPI0015E2D85F|nr:DUF924 family protein [Pseudomonas japonica]MBA1242665.1 DUF924 family protein [Pseudomonas japonica]